MRGYDGEKYKICKIRFFESDHIQVTFIAVCCDNISILNLVTVVTVLNSLTVLNS